MRHAMNANSQNVEAKHQPVDRHKDRRGSHVQGKAFQG